MDYYNQQLVINYFLLIGVDNLIFFLWKILKQNDDFHPHYDALDNDIDDDFVSKFFFFEICKKSKSFLFLIES